MSELVTQVLAGSPAFPERTLHHQRAENGSAQAVCVLLDAKYYLQGGVQYKDVGVVLKYTPDQGGGQKATVGIVIPF